MSNWIERLRSEHNALAEKLMRLEYFLAEISRNEQARDQFDGWQVELMKRQYGHMLAYLQILDLRLKEAK